MATWPPQEPQKTKVNVSGPNGGVQGATLKLKPTEKEIKTKSTVDTVETPPIVNNPSEPRSIAVGSSRVRH